ncbi:MAG: phosphoserine transaminase [Actinobacteria bacterium]|nr:phosphoserine transaminase [Actinomycetota bacterium]
MRCERGEVVTAVPVVAGGHQVEDNCGADHRSAGRSGPHAPPATFVATPAVRDHRETAVRPDLKIPSDLLPADGRFGSGPSKVRPEAIGRLATVGSDLLGTSHRKPAVQDLVRRLQDGLAELFSLPDGYEIVLANGGATAFWEMAAFGIVDGASQHYVFGEFSSKFAASVAAAPWLADPVEVVAEPGQRPALTANPDVDVQALTHNETSTGVMMDVARPEDDALVLVDATSGAGGLPVDLTQTDVYYFSLQKGFASEGGLVVAICSPAAIERILRVSAAGRYIPAFLDLVTAVENSRKHQTYNTPAISTLFLAAEQVDWMNGEGGLDAIVREGERKAAHLYGWADERPWASPFVSDPAARSLVVGTVDLDDAVPADDVNAVLRANGVLDTDAYRKLGRNQLRVGMFPAIPLADVAAYTASVDWIVEQL